MNWILILILGMDWNGIIFLFKHIPSQHCNAVVVFKVADTQIVIQSMVSNWGVGGRGG